MLHQRWLFRMRVLGVATAVAGVILMAGAACSGNNDGKIQALQTSVSTIQQSVTKTQILAALGSLSAANLHDVDTNLQSAPAIDPELLGTSGRRARLRCQRRGRRN